MGHGFKFITLYDQKHIAALEKCHNPPLVHDKPLGAPSSVKLVYWGGQALQIISNVMPKEDNVYISFCFEITFFCKCTI